MERYRVNYWLLGILTLGAVLLGGAVYGIWTIQMSRNADRYKVEADKALAENNIAEAAAALGRYLAVDPQDRDAEVRLASLRIDLAREAIEERRISEYQNAVRGINNVLSRYVDEEELRRKMLELCTYVNDWQSATTHAEILLDDEKNKEEVELLKTYGISLARTQKQDKAIEIYGKLVGYNAKTKEFDIAEPLAPDDQQAYQILAQLMLQKERADEAKQVVDKLVELNPDSALAHVARAQVLPAIAAATLNSTQAEALRDEGNAEIAKAYEIDPDNETVAINYLSKLVREAAEIWGERSELEDGTTEPESGDKDAEIATLTKQLEAQLAEIDRIADGGIAKNPKATAFYEIKSNVARFRNNPEETLRQIKEGIESLDEEDELALIQLQLAQIELLLSRQDIKEAEELLKEVRKQRYAQAEVFARRLDKVEGQILLTGNRWFPAKELLEKLRVQLPSSTPEQRRFISEVDYLLGFAHEKLGNNDLAAASYKSALQNFPENKMAEFGSKRLAKAPIGSSRTTSEADTLVNDELAKPREERDWTKVLTKLENIATTEGWPEIQGTLVRARVFAVSGDFDKAQDELNKIFEQEPDNLNVWRAAIRLVADNPEKGPVEALKLLDKASAPENFGDLPILRLDRALMYTLIEDDDLETKLMQLADGIDDWTQSQKIQLLTGLGERFAVARNNEAAEKMYRRLVELSPDDLATRVRLFKIAFAQSDDAAMEKAQEGILSVVKSKSNANWLYTEAARLFSRYQRDLEDDESTIKKIRTLLAQASQQRPEWNEPYILLGDVELKVGNVEAAIDNLGKGLELGATQPLAALAYINLLTQRGRYSKAREAVEAFDVSLRQQVLGRVYPEILLNTNSPVEAMEAATTLAAARPDDASTQLWYGLLLQRIMPLKSVSDEVRAEATKASGEALAKVVELAPRSEEGWLAYISHLLRSEQPLAAEQAMRDAQLNLPEDLQAMVLGKAYELTGRWFDAENLYRTVLEASPDEPRFARVLAEFYLGNLYPKEDKMLKASKLINQVLQMGADDKLANDDPNLQWARRRAAIILASTGDYQNLIKAEKLLTSNANNGLLSIEDKLQLARILAPRPEPISRLKAIALLEEVKPYQDLPIDFELTLAKLYFAVGNWPKARDLMPSIVAKYPDVPGVRADYIRMLLQRGTRGDISAATTQLDQLVRLDPGSQQTLELIALVADKNGQAEKAQDALRRMVPGNLAQMKKETYPLVLRIAQLLTQLDDAEDAQKIYEALAKINKDEPLYTLELANHLGRTGQPDRAFEILEEVRGSLPMASIIQSAHIIARAARDEIGDKYDDKILGWLERELRDEPGSISLKMQQSEFYDLVGRYEEAAANYRSLLANSDLVGNRRAVVLNNLAYLLVLGAAEEQAPGEAAKLVNEAISILGPSSEILDTRAVLEISRGDYKKAIEDLQYATADNPTASKFFHKAQAHLGARENREAIAAWDQAIELGLDPADISRLEQASYEEVAVAIEKLKGKSCSL